MKKSYFVTGTDTDVGKTLVATSILRALTKRGLKTIGLKPISAGCERIDGELRNADALSLMNAASIELIYEQVNPVAFEPAIAPHIAADLAGVKLSADRLTAICKGSLMRPYDMAIVEGAGGWRVPLNNRETLATVAQQLRLPVIMVVGMKLGCVSHAMLTAEAIQSDGMELYGWVANQIDPDMSEYKANLDWLRRRLPCRFLGEIPFINSDSSQDPAQFLEIDALL